MMCECRHQIPKSALTESECSELRMAGRMVLGFGIFSEQQLGGLLIERIETIEGLRERIRKLEGDEA